MQIPLLNSIERLEMVVMREIGSEFWNIPTCDKGNCIFTNSMQWFLSGRSALKAIISELGEAKSVSLPSWCCDSMIKPFVDAGMQVHFYPVYFENGLIQEIDTSSEILLIMDFFGYTTSNYDLNNYKGIVIRDVTHSIFSAIYNDADFYFGSLRKWCGVWRGGYAWTKDGQMLPIKESGDDGYTLFRERAMQQKNSYINGLGVTDKEYLKLFEEAEEKLEYIGIEPAADRDISLAKQLDVDFIREHRKANATILRTAFSDWLIFPELKSTDCPMFVPVLVPEGKRNELKQFLIKHNIYCPVHWPLSDYHKLNEKELFLYDSELSLVCDQRYTEKDMNRIVEIIKKFMER